MRILIKYLLKNIKEKKLRTLLVLISITLSTALMFSTISIPGTIEKMITDELTKETGTSEIIIYADTTTLTNPFFNKVEIESLEEKLDYSIGAITGNGFYYNDEKLGKDGKNVLIRGYELEDLFTIHNSKLVDMDESKIFTNDSVIIASGVAKILNLSLGDSMEIIINGVNYQFHVYAIASSEGLFDYDNKTINIVVPKTTLASIYQASDLVNIVFIKTIDNSKIEQVLETLSSYYPNLIVRTTITHDELQQNIKMITMPFSLMLVLVIFISIFIIYTTFKVVSIERLPIVGTFRSIGATKKMTVLILLGEGIIYGIIGGILGNLLGIGFLYFMTSSIAYNHYTKIRAAFKLIFGIEHILLSFLFAILISIISAIYPIIKVSKHPVKDIILNYVKEKKSLNNVKLIIGLIMILTSFLIMFIPIKLSIIVCFILLIGLVFAMIFLIPMLTTILGKLFSKINYLIFRNEGSIASKNIRNDKSIINNITLLAIGVAVILMINIVSNSILEETISVYNKANYEINFYHQKADDEVLSRLQEIEGIEDLYGYFVLNNIKIKEKNDYVSIVSGVELEKYLEYWDFDLLGDKEDLLKKFNKERTIITSLTLKEKFGLEEGDIITLKFRTGDVQYKVIGFMNTIYNNGNFIFLPKHFIKEDTKIHYYSDVLIKTSKDANLQHINDLIKKEFKNEHINTSLISDIKEDNVKANKEFLTLLKGFSIITMLIGAFGIINNFIVSLINRKRSIGMYRSLGMSKIQVLKMLLVESITGGMIGSICGILFGVIFIQFADYIMDVLNLPIDMYYELDVFIILFAGGIILSILASLSPALKTTKQNIIEVIKYE